MLALKHSQHAKYPSHTCASVVKNTVSRGRLVIGRRARRTTTAVPTPSLQTSSKVMSMWMLVMSVVAHVSIVMALPNVTALLHLRKLSKGLFARATRSLFTLATRLLEARATSTLAMINVTAATPATHSIHIRKLRCLTCRWRLSPMAVHRSLPFV